MKKLALLSIFSLFILTAWSQDNFGIFGHASLGYAWEDWSKVKDDLRLSDRLGTELDLSNNGVSGGLAGYLVIDRFLIGLKGYGSAFGSHTTPRGKVEMVSGMVFFEMGTLLFANPDGLGYVSAGIGGGGSGVFFENHSDEDWYFGGNGNMQEVHVYRNTEEDFGYVGVSGELGLGLDRWVIGQNGGLMIGLESGINLWLHRWDWENDDIELSDFSHPGNVGFYLRMTIGAGYVDK